MDKDPEHQEPKPGDEESVPDASITPDAARQDAPSRRGEVVEPAKQRPEVANESTEGGAETEAAPTPEVEDTAPVPHFLPRGRISRPTTKPSINDPKVRPAK